jgi:hypothetical protein
LFFSTDLAIVLGYLAAIVALGCYAQRFRGRGGEGTDVISTARRGCRPSTTQGRVRGGDDRWYLK